MDNEEIRTLNSAVSKSFCCAIIGWLYWAKIVRKNDLKNENKNTLCVLVPSNEPNSSFYAIKLLDKAVRNRGFEKAIIITPNEQYIEFAKAMSTSLLSIIICSDVKYKCLLEYSKYTGIDNRVINTSINEPHGRCANKLVGFKEITYESLVAYGIYGLIDYELEGSKESDSLEFLHCLKNKEKRGIISNEL